MVYGIAILNYLAMLVYLKVALLVHNLANVLAPADPVDLDQPTAISNITVLNATDLGPAMEPAVEDVAPPDSNITIIIPPGGAVMQAVQGKANVTVIHNTTAPGEKATVT